MDVGKLDILRDIVQNRVTDPQYLEIEVFMVEAVILENAVAEVMVVTKTARVTGKLKPLQRHMVGAKGRKVIGPIVMLSLGDLKRRHLMLSSQVIFWFVIAWLFVLFDPGSTFSYVSSSFATGLNLHCELLDMPIRVSTLVGECGS